MFRREINRKKLTNECDADLQCFFCHNNKLPAMIEHLNCDTIVTTHGAFENKLKRLQRSNNKQKKHHTWLKHPASATPSGSSTNSNFTTATEKLKMRDVA